MRSPMIVLVFISLLVGCSSPSTASIMPTQHADGSSTTMLRESTAAALPTSSLTETLRSVELATPESTRTTLPLTPPTRSTWSSPLWQSPSGLSYTLNGTAFIVNLTAGNVTARGAAPAHGSILSHDGRWYWISEAGISASNTNGTRSELVLSWAAFNAQFPEYSKFATTLTLRDDQRALFFDASARTPGGSRCSVFALTIVTAVVTPLDLVCGITYSKPIVPRLAPNGRQALGNRRTMPDPPGHWIDSTFLFYQRQDDGGQRLNHAGLLDAVWLSDGRFVYAVDKGDPDLLPAIATDASQIVLADERGMTLRVLATDVVAFHLALAPDEQYLAYITGDYDLGMPFATWTDAARELWVVKLDGSDRRKLTPVPGTVTDLVWYP